MTHKALTFAEKITYSLSPICEKRIIVACSGGPDSLFLLNVLQDFY